MNVAEAAKSLGCAKSHIRNLVCRGKLKASRKEALSVNGGYILDIPKKEIERYRKLKFPKGWKRGKSRKRKTKRAEHKNNENG